MRKPIWALAMGKLFAVVENYPDLKADTQFLNLQRQLSEVEDTIQKARRYYNGTVRRLQHHRRIIPIDDLRLALLVSC